MSSIPTRRGVTATLRTASRTPVRRRPLPAITAMLALLAQMTWGAPDAHAQFVQGSALVPGPAANFPLWGTIASPVSGVLKVDDGYDFASGGNAGANFARVWIAIGTQLGGSMPVSASDTIEYVFVRIDHKGVPEASNNFNMQMNLGGAPAGRVDHLLQLRPVFSGPNVPLTGRVRVSLKRYAVDAQGNYPLLGAFTTSSFVTAATIDNVGSPAEGEAIGWEGVATDGRNGFEVSIPSGWFHGDATRLVQPDGTGASSAVTALFASGGSFGAVATVLDKFADASGNNVLINLSTINGAHSTIVGTQLAYGVQPTSANAYATLGTFTVNQQNSDASTVVGGTASISLSIASGPAGGAMSGTTTRTASNGTAVFNDITFSRPGTYTLTASSTGILSATSSPFAISATPAPAPTITTLSPGNGQLSVFFTAPANDGGSSITTYQYSTDNGTSWFTRATGTTTSPLLITGLTNGTTYTVRIRALTGMGPGFASSGVAGMPDAPIPPSNSVAPVLTGAATVGQSLTTSTGTWGGRPVPTYTYQWRRCDANGATCADITGATASTYLLVPADAGTTLRATVTGTNASGSATSSSAQSAVVAESPANTATPTIGGTPVSGQLLTAMAGTWTGTPAPTYSYQWRRCDANGATCADITGATASTYTLAAGDVGATVRVAVTGTNTAGSATATTAQTGPVAAAPAAPVNTVVPGVTGTAAVGQTLTASTGSWTGNPAPAFTYEWQRCDSAGAACAGITGETASSYTLVPADGAKTLRVVVTATNGSGSATGTSLQTATIAYAPANSMAPTVGGTTTAGQVLTATAGSWTGHPAPALTYQWQRCDADGNGCTALAGETATSYTLVAGDVGATMRVVETGTNSAGGAAATSAQSGVIGAAPVAPVNSVAPSATGTARVGQLLTATTGSWTGYPTPTYTYQWRRCDSSGATCTDISGATASSYTLTSADAGATVLVVVTGANGSGSTTGTSAPVGPVAEPPANTAAPSVGGTAEQGQALTAAAGSWTGFPAPTYTYEWQRCDAAGGNCASITGATSATYTPGSGDVGATIRVAVTGTNGAGTATATSSQTSAVAAAPAAPASTTAPAITGTMVTGELLTAAPGSWAGNPAPTLTYQWQRCDAAGTSCATISGETGTTYALVNADAGSTIRVLETATNASGSAAVSSTVTAAVNMPPSSTVPPIVTGTATNGQTLSASTGSWTGFPAPTYGYQWQRCDAAGASCSIIASATASSYLLTDADVGSTIRAVVTGTNAAGTASAASTPSASIAAAGSAPANIGAPSVSGTTTVGQPLTATTGTWAGTPTPTLSVQWLRCDATGGSCASIAGATTTTYTLAAADTGFTMRIAVTGANASASTTESSAQTTIVLAAPTVPANTTPATIGGTVTVGQTLAMTPGTWTGNPAPTITQQWERCDAAGSNCSAIAGATSTTYTLAAADAGATIRVTETGTNAAGSAMATSTTTAAVAPAPAGPANTLAPAITGTMTEGQLLTVTAGTWTGEPAPGLTYQWQRCDETGANCGDVIGATTGTYTLGQADVGATMRVNIAGTNASGSIVATSAPTALVTRMPAPPVNLVAPVIAGTARVGATLTAAPGDWAGWPMPAATFLWQRCDAAGADCRDIPGATGAQYTPTIDDAGATIRVHATVTNGSGSVVATSAATAPLPTPTSPSIAGTPQVGQPLTVEPGTWAAPEEVAFAWQRCDASGNDCTDIAGATGSTYTPVAGDLGAVIRAVVRSATTGRVRTAVSGPVAPNRASPGSRAYAPLPGSASNLPAGLSAPDSVPADGTRFAAIRMELIDANGNAMVNRAASDFTVTIDGIAVATAVRETATPGVYEFEARSTTVNEVRFGISIDGVLLANRPVVRFVKATADLDITLVASTETPALGETVVFTATVANPGPNSATNVEVTQALGDRVRFVSSNATHGTYDATSGIWTIGNLAVGERATLKVTVIVIK